jgi:tetratricopeptide (TPR) repeat protein
MNSKLLSLGIALVAALLLSAVSALAETVDELLEKGRPFDQQFQATEALKYYLVAEKLEPKDVRVLVRIARQHRHLMADATSKDEKLRLGRIALDYSQRAAALAPNDPDAQFSVGLTLGKMLPLFSKKEQVNASPRIKASVDRTLRLDPRNDYAWHILGRWHRNLAAIGGVKRALAGALYGGLPAGSNEEAAKALEKAIKLNPARLVHYIELGRVYAQMGRKEEARKLINKGLEMPNVDKDDPEMKVAGREALAQLR